MPPNHGNDEERTLGKNRPSVTEHELCLRREVGLFSAIAVIIGSTIGSGIFTTPGIVYSNAGSAGVALAIWCLAGLIALNEALCLTELATLLPASGGSYAYLMAGSKSLGRYGDIVPFMYAWSCLIIIDPMSTAYQGLAFASYALSIVYGDCILPYTTKLTTALTFIVLGIALNCISVKTSARVQDVLSTFKCAVLVAIIITGAVSAFRVNKLLDATLFASATPSSIVRAIFGANLCYAGSHALTYIAEEVSNPTRTVPLANVMGILIITAINVLTNVAYFVVLDAPTVATSQAIAVSFATITWGQAAASCIPAIVSLSAFGNLCAGILTSSRLELAAARESHLPTVLSFISVDTSVPMVSTILHGLLALLYTSAGSLSFIADSIQFAGSLNMIATMVCFFVLRFSMKDVPRPFRVPTVIPILHLTTLVTLVIVVLIRPSGYVQYGIVLLAYLLGGAYYVTFVRLKTDFPGGKAVSVFIQKLVICVPCVNQLDRMLRERKHDGQAAKQR